ncbi:MAG: hypothetical protein K1X35_02565 [Caulobacteraceae bacterium]|nr:hypothetical protein [Caulobacteraceae bacterium]
MIRQSLVLAAAVLTLAACSKPKPGAPESDVVPMPNATTPPPGASTPPARPAGPAEPAQARTDEFAVSGASVTQVEWLSDIDAKMFSNAGGDPAINGLLTYIAFPPESPDEDWAVYQVGDFEEWKVTEHGPGRVVLQVRVSRIDQSSGNPVTEDKRLIVSFGESGGSRTVTVAPAA